MINRRISCAWRVTAPVQGTSKMERYHHPAIEETITHLWFDPRKKVDSFKDSPELFQPVRLPTMALACTLVRDLIPLFMGLTFGGVPA